MFIELKNTDGKEFVINADEILAIRYSPIFDSDLVILRNDVKFEIDIEYKQKLVQTLVENYSTKSLIDD